MNFNAQETLKFWCKGNFRNTTEEKIKQILRRKDINLNEQLTGKTIMMEFFYHYNDNYDILNLLLEHEIVYEVEYKYETFNLLKIVCRLCAFYDIVEYLINNYNRDIYLIIDQLVSNSSQNKNYETAYKITKLLLTKYDKAMDVIIEYGSAYSNSLNAACCTKNEKVIDLLLDHIDRKKLDTFPFPFVLLHACRWSTPYIVERLLKYNLDINIRDTYGGSALLNAVENYGTGDETISEEIVMLLIKFENLDINITDNSGQTVLHKACIYIPYHDEENGKIILRERTSLVKLLLSHKNIDINARMFNDHQPIWLICYRKMKETLKLFLERSDLIFENKEDLYDNEGIKMVFKNMYLMHKKLSDEIFEVDKNENKIDMMFRLIQLLHCNYHQIKCKCY